MPQLKSRPRKKTSAKAIAKKSAPAEQKCVVFHSELGWIALAWLGDEVTLISFGHDSPAAAARRCETEPVVADEVPRWVAKLVAKMQRFTEGKKVDWSDVRLAYGKQSEFQRKVQEAARRIPRGEVLSYGELAAAAGSPGAARAVGSVMRHNRFPLVIPCHRVVASGGKVGGFSCPSGVEMKEKLLALEGVKLK